MTVATATSSATDMWTNWIDARHVSCETVDELRRRVHDEISPVLQLDGFWHPEKFRALAASVRALPQWERLLVLYDESGGVRTASDNQFEAAALARRFSSHDRAIGIEQQLGSSPTIAVEHQRWLRQFFAFAILTPALSSWVGEVFDRRGVGVTSVEFARYRRGDYIAEHTDAVGQRLCHLVTYFDEDYAPADGGGLVVFGRDGRQHRCEPRFNSAILLPLDPANRHRVEPWTAQRPGRWSASIAFQVGPRS